MKFNTKQEAETHASEQLKTLGVGWELALDRISFSQGWKYRLINEQIVIDVHPAREADEVCVAWLDCTNTHIVGRRKNAKEALVALAEAEDKSFEVHIKSVRALHEILGDR